MTDCTQWLFASKSVVHGYREPNTAEDPKLVLRKWNILFGLGLQLREDPGL